MSFSLATVESFLESFLVKDVKQRPLNEDQQAFWQRFSETPFLCFVRPPEQERVFFSPESPHLYSNYYFHLFFDPDRDKLDISQSLACFQNPHLAHEASDDRIAMAPFQYIEGCHSKDELLHRARRYHFCVNRHAFFPESESSRAFSRTCYCGYCGVPLPAYRYQHFYRNVE